MRASGFKNTVEHLCLPRKGLLERRQRDKYLAEEQQCSQSHGSWEYVIGRL